MSLTLEESINAGLTANSPRVAGRITPNRIPAAPVFPLHVYRIITGDEVWHMQGGSGLFETTFEVQTWGNTAQQAREAAQDAYAYFSSLGGLYMTANGVFVQFIRPKQPVDAYHDELKKAVKIMDVELKFRF